MKDIKFVISLNIEMNQYILGKFGLLGSYAKKTNQKLVNGIVLYKYSYRFRLNRVVNEEQDLEYRDMSKRLLRNFQAIRNLTQGIRV